MRCSDDLAMQRWCLVNSSQDVRDSISGSSAGRRAAWSMGSVFVLKCCSSVSLNLCWNYVNNVVVFKEESA